MTEITDEEEEQPANDEINQKEIDVDPNSNVRDLKMITEDVLQRLYRFRSCINYNSLPTDPEIIVMECVYTEFLAEVVNFGNDRILRNFCYPLHMEVE
jgi:hypothetical protein